MIKFTWLKFSELSTKQLYELLALRFDVFVVEQRCFYLDPDGKDVVALHLLGTENGKLVSYARLFTPINEQSKLVFGRVAVAKSARGRGYGKLLMQEILDHCNTFHPNISIKCSAQHYLRKFYEDLGFTAQGDIYEDAGIPHIEMLRLSISEQKVNI